MASSEEKVKYGYRRGRNVELTDTDVANILAEYFDIDTDGIILRWDVNDEGEFCGAIVRVG